jgi:hypothetical protein
MGKTGNVPQWHPKTSRSGWPVPFSAEPYRALLAWREEHAVARALGCALGWTAENEPEPRGRAVCGRLTSMENDSFEAQVSRMNLHNDTQ